MNFIKAETVILVIGFCYLYLCLTGSIPAAENVGTKRFNIYVPVDNVEPLLDCKSLQKLNISGTYIKNITPLKNLPQLDSVSMWNLWLERRQLNELKENLHNLEIKDYQ